MLFRSHWSTTFGHGNGITNPFCTPQPEGLVVRAHEKCDEEGRLTDDRMRGHRQKYLSAFADGVRRFVEAAR